jgi:hypothetical protein
MGMDFSLIILLHVKKKYNNVNSNFDSMPPSLLLKNKLFRLIFREKKYCSTEKTS